MISESSVSESACALAEACLSGDVEGARLALAQGANPNSSVAWRLGAKWGVGGERPRPLHMAFRHGNAAMSKLLMDAGASLNTPSLDGRSSASWLSMGLESCASLWIQAGGDPWRRDLTCADHEEGCLAVVAARGGNQALWDLIIQHPMTGWETHGVSSITKGSLDTIAKKAIKFNNMVALRAIAKLGWAPTGADVVTCLEVWSGKWSQRAWVFKNALILRDLGAPMPNELELSGLVLYFGADASKLLMNDFELSFAKLESKKIAKGTARSNVAANRRASCARL